MGGWVGEEKKKTDPLTLLAEGETGGGEVISDGVRVRGQPGVKVKVKVSAGGKGFWGG